MFCTTTSFKKHNQTILCFHIQYVPRFPGFGGVTKANQAVGMADQDKSNLDAKEPGTVGRQFESDGKVGQVAEKVGGPFSSDGAVGEKFTKEGAIGGKAQEMAEDKSVFHKDGAIGKEFQADGKIGSIGEAVGGPFSSQGAIGKQFTDKGAVGGTIQEQVNKK